MFATVSFGQYKAGDVWIEPYVFENSSHQKVEAEFGRLYVPENRNNPRSRLIELAFIRFKSTSPNPGAPIIYLAGGPGNSGISSAKGSRFPLFMAMREFGDVIALDQRGVGLSKPNLECHETLEDFPLDQVPTRDLFIRLTREKAHQCAEYWRNQGTDLSGYNTNESADDLEALRKALDATKINLWAISYGTHLALTTIRRHEGSIDHAILAGVEGPDHTLKLPSKVQQALVDIDRLVHADSGLSRGIPDFLGLMKGVLDRLEREPVIVEVPVSNAKQKVVVSKFVMQYLTASTIGTGDTMAFPMLYYRASRGDFYLIAGYWLDELRSGIGSAMSFMMDCSSGASPKRRQRIEREARTTLLGNAADLVYPDVCNVWGNPDLGSSFRKPIRSNIPVLFISGTLDGRTPISNAEEVRKGFSHSTHLIIEGAWHGDPLFLSSPKIRDVMLEFLRGAPISNTRIKLAPLQFVSLGPHQGN
ncbi:MAG: hypothetical protein AUG51_19105 [Acidobacteria bacterium 13_1_20CM_3_53_8]|nr:MAG: hypothetical protein AUG51_19105 [Acidobacteria bacterium 13_1_20CM_3_53_8]